MNYQEALAYINDKDKFGSRLGLDSITKLLDLLGNPQDKLEYIHVAGTNGKGSTSSYLASMLKEEGYRVGLFTSPFLERFNERISINGQDIEDQKMADITEEIRESIGLMLDQGWEHPTTFEIVTALAFVYFYREKVDYVVLEVGLGGRSDSTNVIKSPLAALITTIDYDHVDVLGNTLGEIAFEKAGIIKEGSLVVSYPQKPEAAKVIKEVTEGMKGELYICPMDQLKISSTTDRGSVFDFRFKDRVFKDLEVGLLGKYQVYNGTMALFTLLSLRDRGLLEISDDSLYKGLKNTSWKGRLEIISENPRILIDGAHNLQGAEVLKESLKMFDYNKLILCFSVLGDKDYPHIIETLIPLADELVITEINMPRRLSLDKLEEEVSNYKEKVYKEKKIEDAFKKTLELYEDGDLIVFAGSLYFIGDVRRIKKEII